jgi:hypothetical protein
MKLQVAALTEWRRSSRNRRLFLVRSGNRTFSTRSSSGNGAGIDVTLHKGTILKGVLPKLKLSKYRVIHKSVKHFKNLQQVDYATDRDNSHTDRERNSPSFSMENLVHIVTLIYR